MMKKIAIVTATRAEYGLLMPVIRELRRNENCNLKVDLIVTGTHLSEKFGMTVNEIKNDGFRIDFTIPILVNSQNELDISKNQADALVKFTQIFLREQYHAILLLGDRYELLAIAIAAVNTQTPIFHLCGGDTTEGAVDECIRHSITKMGYLHFVTNEESRNRVIQLGEDPQRVFNFGSTSIDNILNYPMMQKEEVLKMIGLNVERYAIGTYHPVTLEKEDISKQIYDFLGAIQRFPQLQFIITKSNADCGGERINMILDAEEPKIENLHVFSSLGMKRYLSLIKYSEFVIGNSSSGIVEAPVFHVPTINIGDRQKGRLQSDSIINCNSDMESIVGAISIALTDETKRKCKSVRSPYGNGTASKRIAEKSLEVLEMEIDLKKKFYCLNGK